MKHHGAGLRRILTAAGVSADDQATLQRALAEDAPRDLPVSAADRALVEYVDRVTRTPWAVTGEDVERLRAAGYDDGAIHDACAITAYFAFVNRTADGLGVQLEDGFDARP